VVWWVLITLAMESGLRSLLFPILVCLSLTFTTVRSISFQVFPDVKKCLREEVHKDVLVVGDYELFPVAGQVTDLAVSIGPG